MINASEIIKRLDLKPHPEGGFYKETYRSVDTIGPGQLAKRYSLALRPSGGRPYQRESLEWQVPPATDGRQEEKAPGAEANQDSPGAISTGAQPRALCTSIYYLITPASYSMLHRLKGDEIYHFYLGDSVEMLNLFPDGSSSVVHLGYDIVSGAKPQHKVGHGVWQGARLVDGGNFALMGTTMSPGFAFSDFEAGKRANLVERYPSSAGLIEKLTRA